MEQTTLQQDQTTETLQSVKSPIHSGVFIREKKAQEVLKLVCPPEGTTQPRSERVAPAGNPSEATMLGKPLEGDENMPPLEVYSKTL